MRLSLYIKIFYLSVLYINMNSNITLITALFTLLLISNIALVLAHRTIKEQRELAAKTTENHKAVSKTTLDVARYISQGGDILIEWQTPEEAQEQKDLGLTFKEYNLWKGRTS